MIDTRCKDKNVWCVPGLDGQKLTPLLVERYYENNDGKLCAVARYHQSGANGKLNQKCEQLAENLYHTYAEALQAINAKYVPEHSQGEWTITFGKYGEASVWAEGVSVAICSVNIDKEMGIDINTAHANARLLKAAPKLLAACLSMLKTCGSSEDWQGETHESLLLIEAAVEEACG